MKCSIGDVLVVDESCTNPYLYRGPFYSGDQRREALKAICEGREIEGVVLWYAPCNGGAYQITRDEVAWPASW